MVNSVIVNIIVYHLDVVGLVVLTTCALEAVPPSKVSTSDEVVKKVLDQ